MNMTNDKGKAEALSKNTCGAVLRSGFTLIEVLTVVLIIGILTSIALPMYMRSIERSRATEAMTAIKALNDSIYAYYADKGYCPNSFGKLVATLPSNETKNFQFILDGSPVNVPGTDCKGVLAKRIHGGSYQYKIWNPYTRGTTGKALALQCAPENESDEKSKAVCESLGLYRGSN